MSSYEWPRCSKVYAFVRVSQSANLENILDKIKILCGNLNDIHIPIEDAELNYSYLLRLGHRCAFLNQLKTRIILEHRQSISS